MDGLIFTDEAAIAGAPVPFLTINSVAPTIMHFGSYGLVMIPLGWVLAHRMGVDGLVWAVIIASLVSGGLLTGRFLRVARRPLRV